MAERKQGEWPTVKRQPVADFAVPDGYFRTGRSVAGTLRMGTEPRVGPNGMLTDGANSDMGMDRVSPRGFDPIGTAKQRYAGEGSTLLSRSIRSRD
jgi:hypothetical protein